jgi:hypothetical protein
MDSDERQSIKQAVSLEQKRRRRHEAKIREEPLLPGTGQEFMDAMLTLATQMRQAKPETKLSEVHDYMLQFGDHNTGFDLNLDKPLQPATESARVA